MTTCQLNGREWKDDLSIWPGKRKALLMCHDGLQTLSAKVVNNKFVTQLPNRVRAKAFNNKLKLFNCLIWLTEPHDSSGYTECISIVNQDYLNPNNITATVKNHDLMPS